MLIGLVILCCGRGHKWLTIGSGSARNRVSLFARRLSTAYVDNLRNACASKICG